MLFLDFEFNQVKEKYVNLVSCVTYDNVSNTKKRWWLHNDKNKQKELKNYLLQFEAFDEIVGFACVAEGRSFISLHLNPMDFTWIDLHIEWRQLTNHNDRLMIGNHLIDGKIVRIPKKKPKWQRRDGEEGSRRLTHSLAECTYKLTGQIRDTEEKKKMRDLIISNPDSFTYEEREKILDYNEEDVVFLETIYNKMISEYERVLKRSDRKHLKSWMHKRGKYAALTAIRESNGYPINLEYVKNFTKAIDYILQDTQREINSFFPDMKPFTWKPKEHKFSFNTKVVKQWIIDNGYADKWHLTDSYKSDAREAKKNKVEIDRNDYLSLKLEAFEDKFAFKHSYPKDNFGAQIVRYLVLKQNLNGFKTKREAGKKIFWDFVGSDGRVRPYMNIFGAQSSRSQPGATGFMFLKPAWMRAMVSPPKGKALAGIDFGSEEFFISALKSKDPNMIAAYLSGDVYYYFAKLAKAVPWDSKREDNEHIRDLFKSTTLGISYLMSKFGLAVKLTQDTGIPHTPDQAQELIDKFAEAFPTFTQHQQDCLDDYYEGEYIKLSDGWIIFKDAIEDNFRSIANGPIQGCIHGDSLIFTKDFGIVKIKDLEGKHRIDVWEGTKFIKADCVKAGLKKKVKITMFNGQEIICSPEHKFLTVNNNGKEKWKLTSQFKSQEYIRLSGTVETYNSTPIYPKALRGSATNSSSNSFNDLNITEKEIGILLGRLASDGYVRRGKGIGWIFAEHEYDVMGIILNILNKTPLKLSIQEYNRTNRSQKITYIRTYSTILEQELKDIKNDLSLCHYISNSMERLSGFLMGYSDGDGTVNRDTMVISFGKGKVKENNARYIQKLFSVLGIKTRLHTYQNLRTNLSIKKEHIGKYILLVGLINKVKQTKLTSIKYTYKKKIIGEVERVKKVEVYEEYIEMYDIANCPDQKFVFDGFVTHNTGGTIMRESDLIAYEKGLYVPFTLHDALYIEYDLNDFSAIDKLYDSMVEGFARSFPDQEELARKIKLDITTWSEEYEDGKIIITPAGHKVKLKKLYIDKRAIEYYEKYKYYLEHDITEL